jgi:hypothetical protein
MQAPRVYLDPVLTQFACFAVGAWYRSVAPNLSRSAGVALVGNVSAWSILRLWLLRTARLVLDPSRSISSLILAVWRADRTARGGCESGWLTKGWSEAGGVESRGPLSLAKCKTVPSPFVVHTDNTKGFQNSG